MDSKEFFLSHDHIEYLQLGLNLCPVHYQNKMTQNKFLQIYLQECWEQYGISPGGNTPQSTNYMATCLPSRKLSKWDEPDTQDTAGEAETSS